MCKHQYYFSRVYTSAIKYDTRSVHTINCIALYCKHSDSGYNLQCKGEGCARNVVEVSEIETLHRRGARAGRRKAKTQSLTVVQECRIQDQEEEEEEKGEVVLLQDIRVTCIAI